jgi:hypothetical protein
MTDLFSAYCQKCQPEVLPDLLAEIPVNHAPALTLCPVQVALLTTSQNLLKNADSSRDQGQCIAGLPLLLPLPAATGAAHWT